jgi:hypothetical protein
MIRRRAKPDGLPFRVYERFGVRTYSIGYKMRSGKWSYRYECAVDDAQKIQELRRKAILESANVKEDRPVGGFSGLIDAWFQWQEDLPDGDKRKRKASTLAENKREAANLKKAWGHFEVDEITRTMGYEYLDACAKVRPEKGNKEMALARLILEFGIRKGVLSENPLNRLTKNKTAKARRRVTAEELALAVEVGRKMKGAPLIVALGLKTAWLCVRRSVEVRAIQRQAIREDGILWHDGKDPTKPAILIEWSDELRATIKEALEIKRSKVAGTMYVFGNLRHGSRYTKGGWKSVLDDLMTECVKVAKERKMPFRKFSLQDCRPMGVSDKLEKGHQDVQDATLHSDGKMVARVYDRREFKRAKPAA